MNGEQFRLKATTTNYIILLIKMQALLLNEINKAKVLKKEEKKTEVLTVLKMLMLNQTC